MKGEQQTESTIFLVGFIVIVGLFIGAAFAVFGDFSTPVDTTESGFQNPEQAAGQLADRADRCWTQADDGVSSRAIDCYEIRITPEETVDEDMVAARIDGFDTEQFSMESIEGGTQTTVKVSWDPNDAEIQISRFRVCNPDAGHDCTMPRCYCETECAPDDGASDPFGCLPDE